jgi:hypothetical protein
MRAIRDQAASFLRLRFCKKEAKIATAVYRAHRPESSDNTGFPPIGLDEPYRVFISQDPILFRGGINFFAYVKNNPINNRDAFGLRCDQFGCIPDPGQDPDNFQPMDSGQAAAAEANAASQAAREPLGKLIVDVTDGIIAITSYVVGAEAPIVVDPSKWFGRGGAEACTKK